MVLLGTCIIQKIIRRTSITHTFQCTPYSPLISFHSPVNLSIYSTSSPIFLYRRGNFSMEVWIKRNRAWLQENYSTHVTTWITNNPRAGNYADCCCSVYIYFRTVICSPLLTLMNNPIVHNSRSISK